MTSPLITATSVNSVWCWSDYSLWAVQNRFDFPLAGFQTKETEIIEWIIWTGLGLEGPDRCEEKQWSEKRVALHTRRIWALEEVKESPDFFPLMRMNLQGEIFFPLRFHGGGRNGAEEEAVRGYLEIMDFRRIHWRKRNIFNGWEKGFQIKIRVMLRK